MMDTVCWPAQFQLQAKKYPKLLLKILSRWWFQILSMDQYYEWYQIEINNIMIMLYMMIFKYS